MTETLTIRSERGDDMPRLLAQLDRMGVHPLLDEHCATHGNWVGLRVGWVTVLWWTHIRSEADHRLNPVEPWAEPRLHTRRASTGPRVHPLDRSADRLAAVLEAWSHDEEWQAFEGAVTQHLRRVYALQPERVRWDRTPARGSWSVPEDGLFPCGHRQDHRPDLPPVQVMLAVRDPLGWPGATDVVPGQHADDPRYRPAITRVRQGVGRRGLL
jgi:transposase